MWSSYGRRMSLVGCLVVWMAVVGVGCGGSGSGEEPEDDGEPAGACQNPAEDCGENTIASCTDDGMCSYEGCESGWVNANDDFEDGCECQLADVSTAWADCDGDGFAATTGGDDARTTEYCTTQTDQPSGTPSVCGDSSDGQWVTDDPSVDGQADCNDEDGQVYPGYPGENSQYEENWLCDGVDNDCDGEIDEPCCTDSDDEFVYGDGAFEVGDGELLRLTKPAEGAPDGATALAVWESQTGVISFGHLDGSGEILGDVETQDFRDSGSGTVPGASIQHIAVDTFDSSYYLVVAVRATGNLEELGGWNNNNRARAYSIRVPDASDLAASVVSDEALRETNEIGGVQVSATESGDSADDTTVTAVAGIRLNDSVGFIVQGCQFPASSPDQCNLENTISETSRTGVIYPQLVETGSGYVAGWWNDDDGINVVQLESDFEVSGEVVRARATVEATTDGNTSEPIELLAHEIDDTFVVDVIYPSFSKDGNANLKLSRRIPPDLDELDEFTLAEATGGGTSGTSHVEPRAVSFGTGGDMVAVWRVRDRNEVTNRVASAQYAATDLGQPASPKYLLDSVLDDIESGGISLSESGRGVTAGWAFGGSSSIVQAHYLSPGGKPICTPTNSNGN